MRIDLKQKNELSFGYLFILAAFCTVLVASSNIISYFTIQKTVTNDYKESAIACASTLSAQLDKNLADKNIADPEKFADIIKTPSYKKQCSLVNSVCRSTKQIKYLYVMGFSEKNKISIYDESFTDDKDNSYLLKYHKWYKGDGFSDFKKDILSNVNDKILTMNFKYTDGKNNSEDIMTVISPWFSASGYKIYICADISLAPLKKETLQNVLFIGIPSTIVLLLVYITCIVLFFARKRRLRRSRAAEAEKVNMQKKSNKEKSLSRMLGDNYSAAYTVDLNESAGYPVYFIKKPFDDAEDGMNFADLGKVFLNEYAHPDEKEAVKKFSNKEYILSSIKKDGYTQFELRRKSDNGYRWTQLRILPVPEEKNTVLVCERDINDRREALAQLHHAHILTQRLSALIKLIFASQTTVDLETGECYYSQYDIAEAEENIQVKDYDATVKKFINQTVEEEFRDKCIEFCSIKYIRSSFKGQYGLSSSINYRTNQELNSVWFRVSILYIPDEDGKPLAVVLRRNIDEIVQTQLALKDAIEKANAASKAKSVFLSNMSHDIRTPLNAITGMAQLAVSHRYEPDRVQACMDKISISSGYLLNLINDVLDMSHIESGKIKIARRPFNIPSLYYNTMSIMQPLFKEKEIKINSDIVNLTSEYIIGDPLRISQIMTNILSNAVKYTPEGGTIDFKITQLKETDDEISLEIKVRDTGIGISKEFLPHVFDLFERERNFTASKIQGAGLGMAITKNLIDMMNGSVTVESTLGKGSVFTVILPLKKQLDNNGLEKIDISNDRILLLSKDFENVEHIQEIFDDIGADYTISDSVEEVLKLTSTAIKEHKPYKIIMLKWLSNSECAEISSRLHTLCGAASTIVACSVNSWLNYEDKARRAGVNSFIQKPIFKSDIYRILKKDEETEKKIMTDIDMTKIKILLVEDNAMNRDIAREIISSTGIMVVAVEDGEDAVNLLKNGETGFTAILMDIQMPKMNGYEATKAIRDMCTEYTNTVPIIAMTANAFEEDRIAAIEAGMNDYVSKPVDMPALIQKIKTIYLSRNN